MKQRYEEEQEQIIAILQEAETAPTKAEVCRKYGISEQTYYRWRQLYGGLDVPHLRRLKQLEAENARLKRLVAEQMLAHETLKEVLEKGAARERAAGTGRGDDSARGVEAGRVPGGGTEAIEPALRPVFGGTSDVQPVEAEGPATTV